MSDFRSDTVTRPTAAMKQAMLAADVGDDVFGDDPTVNRLQETAAEMLGFEAALFAPSGTQTNLIAMMSHCQRGDEAIVGQQWHTYRWEAGGMAVLGSIQPQPLEHQADGTIALADIEAAIKPDDPHFARTRLIVIENTTGGKVLPLSYMREVRALASRHGLQTHIDGARLFNAAVAQSPEDPVRQARLLAESWDSVSLCLSKGLGAPVGSLLLGSRDFIQRARRVRKMLGGGMRQAGVIAAAGLHALQHHVHRLADDHANARMLAEGLGRIIAGHPRLAGMATAHPVQSNILFFDIDASLADDFLRHLDGQGIRVTSGYYRNAERAMKRIRWVTHLDVTADDVRRALQAVEAF
ncbi:MAG TPA: low-specificity L-threonine aldolase [Noviherbaspirillum sp.]|jgi:threonine aldolase|uniref:low-specificity L-threonine aldolase n=1 Tax=Noviherbaspirillum sp. TaxID=1926288 RepID=UPI002F92CCB1